WARRRRLVCPHPAPQSRSRPRPTHAATSPAMARYCASPIGLAMFEHSGRSASPCRPKARMRAAAASTATGGTEPSPGLAEGVIAEDVGCSPGRRSAGPRTSQESAELLHLGEDLGRIRELASTVSLHEPDHALPVDHEARAVARVELRPVDAVALDHVAMNVREQRIRDPAERLGPRVVTVDRVTGDAHDLGIRGLEV